MNFDSWVLLGILACLLAIFYTLTVWLRSWRAFVRSHREEHEAQKKLLLASFSDLIETVRGKPYEDETESVQRIRRLRG